MDKEQKHFCAVCGKEWGPECEATTGWEKHREIDYFLPVSEKISYLQEATGWLWSKMYNEDIENFECALNYFTKYQREYPLPPRPIHITINVING